MSIFGPEFEQVWPKAGCALKLTSFGKNLLNKCQTVEKPNSKDFNMDDFIRKSSNFPLEFGTNTCRVISQPKSRYPIIEKQIPSAYPVIHERVLGLYLGFLEHKCRYGNKIELEVFSSLTLTGFVQRLLDKRCATFMCEDDIYLLTSGEKGVGGFESVGTYNETAPLQLKNVLSYNEIKLSAFLSVSSHSEFINNGSRDNAGIVEENKDKIETEGVIIGLIGGRFERPDVMEWQEVMITPTQNTKQNGYGNAYDEPLDCAQSYRRFWNQFYENNDWLYDDAIKCQIPRLHLISHSSCIFDNLLMKKRYAISFDTLLLDAEARAAAARKQAYIHVVGIGLGVWKIVNHQTEIFLATFAERLKELLPKLEHVSVVNFCWFHPSEYGDLKNDAIYKCESHPNGGIKIYFSKRNPADKLLEKNMLPIVSYAWDGNALPGNEFWQKILSATGDTAAACSTLITELHNPHINTKWVNGENLHIATLNAGIMHIADYCKAISE